MACTEPWHLHTLLEKGSFHERQVVRKPASYFIEPEDWWTFMWGTPMRQRLSELPPEVLEPFKIEILTQVRSRQDERGVWVDASALIGTGIRLHE